MQWYAHVHSTGNASLDGTDPATGKHNAMGKLGNACYMMAFFLDRPNLNHWGTLAQKILDDQAANQQNPTDDPYELDTTLCGVWTAYGVAEDE